MRTLEFSIKGLTEERLRQKRDSRRGPAVIAALLVASIVVLGLKPLPSVRVSPEVVDFGELKVGSLSALQNVSIISTSTQGFGTLVTFSASDATAFDYRTDCAALVPAHSCTVSIQFKPHTVGEQSAQLTVQNDKGHVLAHVDMTGVGVPKEPPPLTVRVSPEVVDFGEHKVGSLSALQNFSITSTSTQSLEARVSFSAADGMAFDFNTQCAVLLPEQSCTVSIRFKPHAVGRRSARLTVQDGNGQVLAHADMAGIGVSGPIVTKPIADPERKEEQPTTKTARLSVDRSKVDFESQAVGSTSASQQIHLLNTSAANFPAGYVVSGDESKHFQVSGCDGGHGSFFFGKECTLDVRFQPQSGGPHDTVVTFRETTNAGKPVNDTMLARIELHGKGLVSGIDVSPGALDFREPHLPRQNVTFRNTGEVPVRVYGARVTGPDARQFQANANPCRSQQIVSGGQCVVTVTHSASSSSRHTAEMVIEYSAGESAVISMYWEPAPVPKFEVDRQSIEFEMVDVGAQSVQSLTLTNIGNVEATSIVAGFFGGDASSFRVAENGCQSATIQPQGRCVITVAFVPTKEGNLSSTLVIANANLKAPATVSVSVNGRGGG